MVESRELDAAATDAPLRVVLVEDADDDAALVVRTLRTAGFQPSIVRVQTAHEFRAALAASPDAVISDHSLPSFSSMAALTCVREHEIDVPFIVVSGTIDEESAVSILKAGAHDFVTKQNLARLGTALRRELQEARIRAERRKARADLRVQRDFLRLLIDANPALIFAMTSTGVFTLANRAMAELYCTSVDRLVGKTAKESLGDRQAEFLSVAPAVVASGQPRYVSQEAIPDAATGEARWFETRLIPLVLPDGTAQVLGIGTEITQRRLAEEALRVTEEQFRQAQKMEAVGQLAGGIAHDFNNILTAILGYSDLLLDSLRDQPEVARDVKEIRRAGERAENLTRQLLAFSRKQILEPRILDLHQVVRGVEQMVRRVLHDAISFEIATAPGLRPVKADCGQVEQVLLNLAINARDAMPTGGTLRIETANTTHPSDAATPQAGASARWVSLSVTDTGSGMPPEVQNRIFEPFFTTKAPGKGTGLGLSMVYGVVTQSGGSISVDSEPGRGTRFTVYFPAVEHTVAPVAATQATLPVELRGHETILLVEDEVAIRELVRKVLMAYGYHVLDAAEGSVAMTLAQRHDGPVHLLLSDIGIPRMSGPELAQRLVPLRPEMRVLYMTGFANRLSADLGVLSPAVSVLRKPFTPDRLAAKVRECLTK